MQLNIFIFKTTIRKTKKTHFYYLPNIQCKACVDLCFATNQPKTYNVIFPFESLCMAQEIVATVQLPHPLVGIKTPNNQKTLILELSTAQGGGESVEASI